MPALPRKFTPKMTRLKLNGTRGDVSLRVLDPSDYQVSVLEVVGTNDLSRIGEISALEAKVAE